MSKESYRPELGWLQLVSNEIVSVTNAMRRSRNPSLNESQQIHIPVIFKEKEGVNNLKDFLAKVHKRPKGSIGSPFLGVGVPLLAIEFTRLRSKLASLSSTAFIKLDLRDLDPSDLLHPFLQVIKSGDTTGSITGIALTSVQNFISFRILGSFD